jgi:hypothetical protein
MLAEHAQLGAGGEAHDDERVAVDIDIDAGASVIALPAAVRSPTLTLSAGVSSVATGAWFVGAGGFGSTTTPSTTSTRFSKLCVISPDECQAKT